jgi:hypothetical protein
MRGGIFIAIVISIPFCIVGGFNLFYPPLNWFVLLIGPYFFIVSYLFLFLNTVTIKERTLKITTIFTSSEIPYEDIQKAQIKLQIRGNPPYQMRIFHKNARIRNPILINIKIFSKKDLQILALTLIEKAPHADIDAAIQRMIKGQIPSLLSNKDGFPPARE